LLGMGVGEPALWPPLAVGSASGCVASGSCTTSPSPFRKAGDRSSPVRTGMGGHGFLADYSQDPPAEVAHIKPLLPSQKAPSRHIAADPNSGPTSQAVLAVIPGDIVPLLPKKIVAIVDDDAEMRESYGGSAVGIRIWHGNLRFGGSLPHLPPRPSQARLPRHRHSARRHFRRPNWCIN